MAKDVQVRCRCGEVVGLVTNASPQKVNRVVCYCDDCQAFAHQLGRADLLNAQGGSDIVQVAPASLTFTKGQDRIAGMRLTPKGLFRWHTTCCIESPTSLCWMVIRPSRQPLDTRSRRVWRKR